MSNPVVDAIRSVVSDPHLQAAMLMGSALESSWNPNAVGDNGKSFGPYQIYTVAHPNVSAAQAKDPVWATKFMLPSYQAALGKVNSSLWQTDPAKAAATVAFYAERPKVMYPNYEAKWSQVQAALAGADISGPVTGGIGGGAADTGSSGGLLGPIDDTINTWAENLRRGLIILANMMLFFAAALVGGIMLLVGLVLIFRQTGGSGVGGQVKSAAKTVVPNVVVKAVSRG